MVKTTLRVNDNIDISNYHRLTYFYKKPKRLCGKKIPSFDWRTSHAISKRCFRQQIFTSEGKLSYFLMIVINLNTNVLCCKGSWRMSEHNSRFLYNTLFGASRMEAEAEIIPIEAPPKSLSLPE